MKELFNKFLDNNILNRSAALAYYASLAITPLVILTMTILAKLNLESQDFLISEVTKLIGPMAGDLLKTIMDSAQKAANISKAPSIISLCFLIFSSSIIFKQLQETLNIIFEVKFEKKEGSKAIKQEVKNILIQRVLSIGMVFTFIFFIAVFLVASSTVSYIFGDYSAWIVKPAQFILNLSVFTILFGTVIKILPQKSISFKRSFFAGLITSVLFIFGKEIIQVYLANAAISSSYGAAGSLAVLLLWIHYSAIIFYVGAQISQKFVIDR